MRRWSCSSGWRGGSDCRCARTPGGSSGGTAVAVAGPGLGAVRLDSGDLLAQGRSAVVDSPCRYPELLTSGLAVAASGGPVSAAAASASTSTGSSVCSTVCASESSR